MTVLKIYTDGGCSGNQRRDNFGGWGAILEYGSHSREIYGGESNTTNNRMELTAVIEALKALTRENMEIQVFTDSAYVSNCFREKWHESWERNKWRNAAKKPVENRDLWEELLSLVGKHEVVFFRVKGHVDLDGKSADPAGLYEKFLGWNGTQFSFEDFKHVTHMNNRADKLSNMGISRVRGEMQNGEKSRDCVDGSEGPHR